MNFWKPSLLLTAIAAIAAGASPCPTIGATSFEGSPNSPYLTAGGGCNVIITIAAGGTVSTSTPNSQPYDGIEDTLVGIVNNSSTAVASLTVSGSGISGWDGDGICLFAAGGGAGDTWSGQSSAYCTSSALTGTDPQDYYGPNMTFSAFSSGNSVTLNFSPALAAGATTFFSLEAPPQALTVGTPVPAPTTPTTPAPSSLILMMIGLAALAAFFVGRGKFAAI
jgi:hypothetical protein